MSKRADYFARVRPVLGEGLRSCQVSARDLSVTGRIVELLAGCMLQRVRLPSLPEPAVEPLPRLYGLPGRAARSAQRLLLEFLAWKNRFEPVRPGLARAEIDLQLEGSWLPAGEAHRVAWDEPSRTVRLELARDDLPGALNLCGLVAWQAREILLRRQPWPAGRFFHGSAAWPFSLTRVPLPQSQARERSLAGKHLMVIGCGSVGSEAVRLLRGRGLRWTLIDGGQVSAFNPSRQWFGSDEVGAAKVMALRRRLQPESVRISRQPAGSGRLGGLQRLLRQDRPDAVLLATGTADHAALAGLLWREQIPHLAACAYPRARFFEVGLVLPMAGTPCLSCFRGLLIGPAAPPLEDELAHVLYRPLRDGERERLYRDLVAEPATSIETGRVAETAALLLGQLLLPAPHRTSWFHRLLDESTTWLLGSNVQEPNPYGLSFAGQVVRLGLQDLASFDVEHRCPVCGRRRHDAEPLQLPQAAAEIVDLALLG